MVFSEVGYSLIFDWFLEKIQIFRIELQFEENWTVGQKLKKRASSCKVVFRGRYILILVNKINTSFKP